MLTLFNDAYKSEVGTLNQTRAQMAILSLLNVQNTIFLFRIQGRPEESASIQGLLLCNALK